MADFYVISIYGIRDLMESIIELMEGIMEWIISIRQRPW